MLEPASSRSIYLDGSEYRLGTRLSAVRQDGWEPAAVTRFLLQRLYSRSPAAIRALFAEPNGRGLLDRELISEAMRGLESGRYVLLRRHSGSRSAARISLEGVQVPEGWGEEARAWEAEPAANPPPISEDEELTWIALQLTEPDGTPVAGERFQVELPDGSTRTGFTDDNGLARVTDIPAGSCNITFPDLPPDGWS